MSFIIALQKIATWFQNNLNSTKDTDQVPKPQGGKSYIRTYTTKDIAGSLHKDRISEIIAQKTDEPSGSKDWLRHYPAALAAVYKDLTEEELEECQEKQKEWNETGPTKEEQQKYVNDNHYSHLISSQLCVEMQKETLGVWFVNLWLIWTEIWGPRYS